MNGTVEPADRKLLRGYEFPSAEWRCSPNNFASGDGCHCFCGAHDPDCDRETQPSIGCKGDNVCTDLEECAPRGHVGSVRKRLDVRMNISVFSPTHVPEFLYYAENASAPISWTCPPVYYNSNDGCDCNCGAWDPDCERPDAAENIVNCGTAGAWTGCSRDSLACVGYEFSQKKDAASSLAKKKAEAKHSSMASIKSHILNAKKSAPPRSMPERQSRRHHPKQSSYKKHTRRLLSRCCVCANAV